MKKPVYIPPQLHSVLFRAERGLAQSILSPEQFEIDLQFYDGLNNNRETEIFIPRENWSDNDNDNQFWL